MQNDDLASANRLVDIQTGIAGNARVPNVSNERLAELIEDCVRERRAGPWFQDVEVALRELAARRTRAHLPPHDYRHLPIPAASDETDREVITENRS